jgi:RecJ-like exonuclease
MYKCILMLTALLCGCSSASEDLRPFVAVAGRYSLMATAKPAPAPSTDCMNCRGTGKVGDGTVMSKCPVCNGTGKIVSAYEFRPQFGRDGARTGPRAPP